MDDLEPGPPLSEKRRRYFEARDKYFAEKKGFRKLSVDSGPSGPQFIMVLLCLLGMALVVFQIFGPALYREGAEDITDVFPGDELEGEVAPSVRLDPEPLKSHLIRLELALFEPPAAGSFESVTDNLLFELDRFVDYLRTVQDPRHQALAEEVEELATKARLEGLDLKAFGSLQNDWLQVRRDSLRSATWFRRPVPTETAEEATYAVYRDIADQLLRHVGSGLTEAEDAIEENDEIGTLEVDAQRRTALQETWMDEARAWRSEVESLEGLMPRRPEPSAPTEVLAAIHRLETALRESRDALPVDRLPTRADLTSLEEVLARAQFAVEAFDNLER